MAGFGGVISEVGASIMVGGNIKGYSRVLTTATVMETGKGNFDIAMALGIILLLLAFFINSILTTYPAEGEAAVNTENAILEVKNLQVKRGGVSVLDISSLFVPEGKVLCLIGPNGAGKSTLLLALSRLLKSVNGDIIFRGQKIDSNHTTGHVSKAYCHGISGTPPL